MTVGAAAIEPSSPASMTQRATSATTTRRRSKNTYRTRRRMSLGTIWISIMCTTRGTSRVGQYNTAGAAEVGQEKLPSFRPAILHETFRADESLHLGTNEPA